MCSVVHVYTYVNHEGWWNRYRRKGRLSTPLASKVTSLNRFKSINLSVVPVRVAEYGH